MQQLQLIYLYMVLVFLRYQELGLSCKERMYFEHYLSLYVDKVSQKSRRIKHSHGMTRKNTELRTSRSIATE